MTEEVIIDLKLDQDEGDFAKLAQLKTALLNIKTEQAQLSRAYKEGSITIKEFASESVRLEANQKKLSAAYTETQRKVTGLKSPFDELNKSIKAQSEQIRVAGISLSTFANPVTATIGLLGGLFKAYSMSTIGAKDLEFASNQLSAATVMLTNDMARLVSTAEDGEGFFTKLLNFSLGAIGPVGGALAAASKGAAMAIESLEDLGRESVKIQAENSERLAENAELMTKLADSQESYNDKLRFAQMIMTNIGINRDESLKIANQELDNLKQQLKGREGDEKLLDLIGLKELEISKIRKDAERQISRIEKQESNILDAQRKQSEELEKQNKIREESEAKIKEKIDEALKQAEENEEIKAVDAENNAMRILDIEVRRRIKERELREKDRKENEKAEKDKTKISDLENKVRLATISRSLGMAAELFHKETVAYKALAVSRAIIDTYAAATEALPNFLLAAIVTGVGLANVAQILGVGFAEGGKIEGRMGTPIRRKNGDDRIITAKTGEVILNERQQAALGGPSTFARIGVPGFSSTNIGQTGFAIGGKIPMPDDSSMLLRRSIDKMHVAVVIEDIENLSGIRARIVEKASL